MIARGNLGKDLSITTFADRTYKIDFDRKRISGKIEGIEAVRQSVYLILMTPRYEHMIYSFHYGSEADRLIGFDKNYVRSEIKRLVKDAVMQDDRVKGVENFEYRDKAGSFFISFDVMTAFGVVTEGLEVKM